MLRELLILLSISMALSCAAASSSVLPPSSQGPVSKELDTVSQLAIAHESGEALSFVVLGRTHYIAYLQSDKKDIPELVKAINCALNAYVSLNLPGSPGLKDLTTQYSVLFGKCE